MWKWAQGAVASVAGLQEPDYGAEAFQSIDSIIGDENPFDELTRKDLGWRQPPQSHVETQTFYFHNPQFYGFVQVIHSNPVNLTYTSQFTFLFCKTNDPNFKIWGSHHLDNGEVCGTNNTDFKADRFSIRLSDDLKSYRFTGECGEKAMVDLKFTQDGSGFKLKHDGYSKYGTDMHNPWGTMRHYFWPRCTVEGSIILRQHGELLEVNPEETRGLYIMALQGMKPHHCASKWNFLDFQGPTVSAGCINFVTPSSYGQGTSAIGGVTKDGKLLLTAVNVEIEHIDSKEDPSEDVDWKVPQAIKFIFKGPKPDGPKDQLVTAEVTGKLNNMFGRVDVMSELPSFVKRVATGLSGAKPVIYQFYDDLEIKITDGDETFTEKAKGFYEASFVSYK